MAKVSWVMMVTVVAWVCVGVFQARGVRNRNLGDHMSRGIILREGGAPPDRAGDINLSMDQEDTCTGEYKSIPGHTMCMTDDPRTSGSGVTSQERQEILKQHNEARGSVQPPATDMPALVWNDDLAAVAQKWAKQCVMGHDSERSVPDLGLSVGQNVAGGYRTWQAAIKGWHDEVKLYRFGREPDSYLGKNGWGQIAHYTQMVQNTTYLVGCGFATCRNSEFGRYYVCNYANGQSRLAHPYTPGPRCKACRSSCKNGLCDCRGRVCRNGGTLDLNTCTCQCPPLYKGNDCSQMNCPKEDPFYCGRDVGQAECEKYYNVPHMCPFMCGLCTGGENVEIVATPEVVPAEEIYTSPFGCKYEGKRATPAECRGYGDKGADKDFCASRGGPFGCNECTQFFNIKRDYCPVQCGLCEPPCGGKVCENEGKLDAESCTCQCTPPFSGPTCGNMDCPAKDQDHCSFYQANFCQDYINVPQECPYKCGLCKH